MLNQRGFSLLEALIASFILFIVLVAVTSLYSGATKSSIRASSSAELHYQVPVIVEQVRYQLHDENKSSGDGQWQGLSYRWSAKLSKEQALWYDEYLSQNNIDTTQKIKLVDITLTITNDDQERVFSYKEVTW